MTEKLQKKPSYNMWQNTGFMIRRAWETCKSVLFLCVALAVVTSALNVAQLLIAPVLIGKVESAAPLGELIAAIGFFAAALILLAGLRAYINSNVLCGRVEVRSSIMLLQGDKLARTSYPNLMDEKFNTLLTKAYDATDSNDRATEHIWTLWTNILTNGIGFIVYLFMLSGLNPLLAAMVTVTAVIGYFVSKKTNDWSYAHKEDIAKEEKTFWNLCDITTECAHAKDIRIFGLRTWINDLWDSSMRTFEAFICRREKVYLWSNISDLLLTLLRNGVAYAYLLHRALTEGMSASQFLLYFAAVGGFTQWITGLLDMFTQLHKESLDLCVVREHLEYPEQFKFEDGEKLERNPDGKYEIILEDVSYRYPGAEQDTLTGINLIIHPGEKLAIVGLNGAGKTTLVKLVCGFLDPTAGRVLLNGEDIRKYNRRDYYALFSAVFQNFSVLDVSVAENVAQSVDDIDMERVWQCLDRTGLTEKVKSLPKGIDTAIGRRVFLDGVELSGGQTQLLMLARALYKDGPILALDEPTAALDPIAENNIYLKYSEMTKGRTSIFISHRLASTRFCDRILFISNGKITEQGTHEQLMAFGGGYAELFNVQSRYYKEGAMNDGEEE